MNSYRGNSCMSRLHIFYLNMYVYSKYTMSKSNIFVKKERKTREPILNISTNLIDH